MLAPGGPLKSREIRHYRARIATEAGWSDWSPVLTVEAGLHEASDWAAEAVTLPGRPRVRAAVTVAVASTRVRSRGRRREGAALCDLARGPSGVDQRPTRHPTSCSTLVGPAIDHRLLAATYDVTALLSSGRNVVSGVLGDGWYRGRLGVGPDRRSTGLAMERISGSSPSSRSSCPMGRRCASSPMRIGWHRPVRSVRPISMTGRSSTSRARQAGWELPGFDATGWMPAAVIPFDKSLIRPRTVAASPGGRDASNHQVAQPIGRQDHPRRRPEPGRFRPSQGEGADRGDQVTVRHAEVLESDGDAPHPVIEIGQGHRHLHPGRWRRGGSGADFTFHGFQVRRGRDRSRVHFGRVRRNQLRPPAARVGSSARIQSLNRLHENVVWSQRGNFVSVPTDCPQRDERLGWTGDAQAFAPTACTLFESAAVLGELAGGPGPGSGRCAWGAECGS